MFRGRDQEPHQLPAVWAASEVELRLVFNDGSENTIDFAKWLVGPVFEPLKTADFFRRFFVDGGTVVWPNGADVAPETLYEKAGRRRRPGKRVRTKTPVRRSAATRSTRLRARR
jgi:hypothetical protein